MFSRAFTVVSDERFFPGLWALLNSIFAYHGCEYRVFVVAHQLPHRQLLALRQHPLGSAMTILDSQSFARVPDGTWEAKQFALSELAGRAENVCLLDADLVLLSRVDDVFEWSEAGKIVSSQDGERDLEFGEEYASYGARLIGRRAPYFNSGFLCLNLLQHWDLIALWEFSGRFAAYSPSGGAPYAFKGHGDQGLLNAVSAWLEKRDLVHLLPQSTWCNSAGWTSDETVDIVAEDAPRLTVMNRRRQDLQRLVHSTGPKWWTGEGAEHFRKSGDVMKCFEHFTLINPIPKIDCDDPVSLFPGDMRYVGDISRQDAQILATSAGTARRILEFGVGGSTQILAQVAPPDATITTVETSPEWIERTRSNLQRFQIKTHVEFLEFESWLSADVGLMDLVFVDGRDDLRAAFAMRAWRFLRVGGVLLIHDTRRRNDANYALEFAKLYYLEIESVFLNVRASNITMITKKMSEPYVDWNRLDG